MRRSLLLLFPTCLLAGAACSTDKTMDATILDGSVEDGGSTDPGGPVFVADVVEGLNTASLVGDFAVLRVNAQGQPVLAYGYKPSGTRDSFIHYAVQATDGTWAIEPVIQTNLRGRNMGGDLLGLGFDLVNGVPHIAYWGGDFDADSNPNSTPITDLMLSTKNGANWTERTLVDGSGEAATTCEGQNYCNFGNVVGPHPALRARPGGGYGVVYRDIHNGFAMEDFARADCEYFGEGGGVTGNIMIDAVRSGGQNTDLIFDKNGSPVTTYWIELEGADPRRTGVWAAYYDGSQFQDVQISHDATGSRTSLALAPDGTLWLAFHDVNSDDLYVASSSDDGHTWANTPVDQLGKTGIHPSIAIDMLGRPVVAYTFCGPASDRECPGTLGGTAEVRLARLEGGTWKKYLVDDGQGFGGVGFFNQIAVLPDGKLVVAFQNSTNNDLVMAKEQ